MIAFNHNLMKMMCKECDQLHKINQASDETFKQKFRKFYYSLLSQMYFASENIV